MLNENDRGAHSDRRRAAVVVRLNQLAERDRHARSLFQIDRAIPLREVDSLVQVEPRSGRVAVVGACRSAERDWPRTHYGRFDATCRLEHP